MVDEFGLPGLAEGEAVNGEGAEDVGEATAVDAERVEGDDPLDLGPWSDFDVPVGDEFALAGFDPLLMVGDLEQALPDVVGRVEWVASERLTVLAGDLLADDEALEAVDPALALFEVDRVAGEVPVDDPAAVGMEVETLLADGGGG